MRPHVKAAIDELDAEIRDLIAARDALLRLDTGPTTPAPTAPRARPAKPAAARKTRSAKKSAAKPEAAETPEASDTGVRILKFLDKNGPTRIEGIAPGTKLKPNIVAIGLNKLVRDGLAEDNDGHFRCTDKGLDAALA